MKFFIDTANIEEIKKANDLGLLDGVTTNPTLVSREGREFKELIKETHDHESRYSLLLDDSAKVYNDLYVQLIPFNKLKWYQFKKINKRHQSDVLMERIKLIWNTYVLRNVATLL